MDQYQYMVAYTFFSEFGGGSGRVFITRNAPISAPEDIEAIEAIQNERNDFACGITGFFLLNHSTTDDEAGA